MCAGDRSKSSIKNLYLLKVRKIILPYLAKFLRQ